MLLALPTLCDLILVCANAGADEMVEWEAFTGTPWDAERVAVELYRREGPKFVLLDGEDRIAAGGLDVQRTDVYAGWMVGSDEAWETRGATISRHVRKVHDHAFAHGARRIEIRTLASRTKACRWYMKGLRMRHEGTHPEFGVNGESAVTYARTSPGEGRHGRR